MAILFAGFEDTSFTFVGGPAVLTTTQPYRPAFSRSAIRVGNGGSTADPPANRLQTPAFTSVGTVWLHSQVYVGINGGNAATTANVQAILLRSPDGLVRVMLRQTGTTGQLKLSTRNAAGTITDVATATGVITQGQHAIDWQVAFATGSTVYWDGTAILTYSGDLRTDAATQLNQVDLCSLNNSNQNSNDIGWSEVIVADTDTRSMALWTLAPQAAGNTQSWTPNTVGNVNPVAINDASFISTAANNALSEWTGPTAPPPGVLNVLAVVQNARVQVQVTGPQHFDWLVRTAATDYLASAPQAPATAFGNFQHIWPTNPNTSAAWQITDLTATGFNLGIESQA
jgi:hypothetical protein